MTKITAYGLVIITITFTVLGQLLVKSQAMHAGSLPASWPGRVSFFLNLILNPWIMAGLVSAVIAAFAWILAMTKLPLNVAYPMVAMTYPLVFVLGWLFFREQVSLWQFAGVVLILLGVALVGLR